MLKFVIATNNPNKLLEIQAILKNLPYEFIGLDSIPNIPPIEETGATLLENSLIKARTVYNLTGLPTIGDDTGLEVKCLNGAPGVLSARYAGENATYNDNLNKLLTELEGIPFGKRHARFKTVISLVTDLNEQWVEGIIEGIIIDKPRGTRGFGYDPVFYLSELKKTLSELSMVDKNKISHRRLALEKFRILLGKYNLTK